MLRAMRMTLAGAIALVPAGLWAQAAIGPREPVAGRVTTVNGQPLQGAKVQARAYEQSRLNLTPVAEAVSDAQGNFEIQVSPGQYLFDADMAGYLVIGQ